MSKNSLELNDLGLLPKSGEVPLIASYQVIGTGSVGTFQENIVIWISCKLRQPRWSNGVTYDF